jgi:glycosyltransferase involved in cell wall biosynthesis
VKPPQVVIAHPARQYSHQTVYSLQEGRMLCRYYTIFWYNKSFFKKIEKILPDPIVKSFKKRNFEPIDVSRIKINYKLFVFEIMNRFLKNDRNNIHLLFDKWVSEEIKQLDFDVFIGYEPAVLGAFRVCKSLGKITVLDLAAEHHEKQKEIWKAINHFPIKPEKLEEINRIKEEELNLADFVLTPSEYSKKTLIDGGVPEEKIVKIPYGVNLASFEIKKNYRKKGKFKILFVGSITIRKGIRYLLDAYKSAGLKDSELILIGGMADAEEVLKKYDGLYTYIPFISQERLREYYQDADIFVFPSLLDSFAMVVIEAMACGTPVIVSENTGAKDAVRNGVDGFIVPIMDKNAVQEKIVYFYENRDMLEEMGRNARTQAEKYSWERYRSNIREAVQRISTGRT